MTNEMKNAVKSVTEVVAETALEVLITNPKDVVLIGTVAAMFARDNKFFYNEITHHIITWLEKNQVAESSKQYLIENRLLTTTEQFVEFLADKYIRSI